MHVDWPSIAECAQANGLRVAGFTDQHHFLTGIISTWPDLLHARWSASLQTLLHPEMLGRAFQVLALSKNVDPAAPKLAGFKFARKPGFVIGVSRDTTPESRARRGHRC
jgi:SAM-dependent MidA family methyltransferase